MACRETSMVILSRRHVTKPQRIADVESNSRAVRITRRRRARTLLSTTRSSTDAKAWPIGRLAPAGIGWVSCIMQTPRLSFPVEYSRLLLLYLTRKRTLDSRTPHCYAIIIQFRGIID